MNDIISGGNITAQGVLRRDFMGFISIYICLIQSVPFWKIFTINMKIFV